ncbi:MAG TPA: hypothetical protein VJ553_07600 [Candidatus Paceibacterota bacterium]|nr:hypothetical protein [Candidatus Paceibacterota bacterium]
MAMAADRRTFLKAGTGTVLLVGLRGIGRVVMTRVIPVVARTIPRWRFNLLRYWR